MPRFKTRAPRKSPQIFRRATRHARFHAQARTFEPRQNPLAAKPFSAPICAVLFKSFKLFDEPRFEARDLFRPVLQEVDAVDDDDQSVHCANCARVISAARARCVPDNKSAISKCSWASVHAAEGCFRAGTSA